MKIIKYIIAAILALLLFGCKNSEEKIVRPVEVIKIETKNKTDFKNFSGIVISNTSSDLAFRVEGQIKKIYVKDGDKVKKGQILGELDNIIYRIEENEMSANLNDAENIFENAQSYYKRIDMLHKEGGISDSDYEKALTNMKSAKYGIKIAKERLNLAKEKASYGYLKAPSDGIVGLKIKNEGDYVMSKDTVIKFISDDMPQIKITIPQNYIDEFKIGENCEISLDSIPEKTFRGKIYSISPSSVDRSGYEAKINFIESNSEIFSGMSGEVVFRKNIINSKEKLWLPLSATMSDNRGIYVFVVDKNMAKKKYVEIGEMISGEIEIKKGLKEGEEVVNKGVSKIQDGQEIKILRNDWFFI